MSVPSAFDPQAIWRDGELVDKPEIRSPTNGLGVVVSELNHGGFGGEGLTLSHYTAADTRTGTHLAGIDAALGQRMRTSVYDPAGISQQLVGTSAAQELSGKAVFLPVDSSLANHASGVLSLASIAEPVAVIAVTIDGTVASITPPDWSTGFPASHDFGFVLRLRRGSADVVITDIAAHANVTLHGSAPQAEAGQGLDLFFSSEDGLDWLVLGGPANLARTNQPNAFGGNPITAYTNGLKRLSGALQTLNDATAADGDTLVNTGAATTWTLASRLTSAETARSAHLVIRNRGSGDITLAAGGLTILGDTGPIPVGKSASLEWEHDGTTERVWIEISA